MSSIKCPQCNLINFASSQYCKRCNYDLSSPGAINNATRVVNSGQDTSVRPTAPRRQPPPPRPQQYMQPVAQNLPMFPEPYQNQPQPLYQEPAPQYQHQTAPPQDNYQSNYTLPRFHDRSQYNQGRYNAPRNNHFAQQQGLWRRGSEFVMDRNASFPQICVKCGCYFDHRSGGSYVTEKHRWHNPLLYIALISPLIYVILSLCLSESVELQVPLCDSHAESKEKKKNFLIGGAMGSVALILILGYFGATTLAIFAAIAAVFTLPIIYEYSYKSVRLTKIDGQYLHLSGADQSFLNSLPY